MEYKQIYGLILYIVCFTEFVFGNTSNSTVPDKIKIKLGFVAPLDNRLAATATLGRELDSVFRLAVEVINARARKQGSKIVLETDFSSQVKDSGYNDKLKCREIAKQFVADPKIVGVVGAFRSTCSIELNQYFKTKSRTLTQISYGSTAVELSDKLNYPRFFRTVPSDIHQAEALADIIKMYKWKKVSTIATGDRDGQDFANAFQNEVQKRNVNVLESARFNRGDTSQVVQTKVEQIKKGETRINVISALPNDAFTAFHQIRQLRMTGEGWVWIASDKVSAASLRNEPTLREAMNGLIGLTVKSGGGPKYVDLVVLWSDKEEGKYPGVIWSYDTPKMSPFAPQVFDAVSAYFKAFDKLARRGIIQPGESNSRLRDIVFDELKNFNAQDGFDSATGPPSYFDENQDAPPYYDIVNLVDNEWKQVGYWSRRRSGLSLLPGKIRWPGDTMQPPSDTGKPGKITLKIGFITPFYPSLSGLADLGKQYLEGFQTALEMFNNDQSLAVDFLGIEHDSGEKPSQSCQEIASKFAKSDVVAVIGAYRSICSMKAADILGTSNNMIPQISYASTSSKLSDVSSTYKYFFRTAPSNVDQAIAIVALIKLYKWKKVCTIATNDAYGQDLTELVLAELAKTNVSVTVTEKFQTRAHAGIVRPKVAKLKRAGCNVGLVFMVRNDAEVVFQQLKELDMVGRGWIWIGSDKSTTSVFDDATNLQEAMQGVIGIHPSHGEGRLFDQFMLALARREASHYHEKKHSHSKTTYLAHLFDAFHGMALELSELARKEIITSKSKIIDIRKALYDKLKRANKKEAGFTSAIGGGGIMFFDKKQGGPPAFEVVNLVGKQWKTVGSYIPRTKSISLFRDPIFSGGVTIPIVGPVKPSYKIAAFFPTSELFGPIADLAEEWKSAFKIAVKTINSDSVYNIHLEYDIIETSVDVDSCRKQAAMLTDDVDMIIGEARSECSIAISKQTNHSAIPQISYASTSPFLSDKTKYPYFFRTCPSDVHQAKALGKLVTHHEWKALGTISVKDEYSKELIRRTEKELQNDGINLAAQERMTPRKFREIAGHLRKIKDSKMAVNLVVSRTDDAEKIFQTAIDMGMTGKGWTWLGTDGSTSSTFKRSPNLQSAMQGMVGTRPRGGKGSVYEKFLKEWKNSERNDFPGIIHTSRIEQVSAYVPQVFDAVLAYATALQRLYEVDLINEKTDRKVLRRHLLDELRKMKNEKNGFDSATGSKQYFSEKQDGVPVYDVVNLNGESWVKVGSYTPKDGLQLTGHIVWSGGGLSTPSEQQQQDAPSTRVQEIVDRKVLIALCVIFALFTLVVIIAVTLWIVTKFKCCCARDEVGYVNGQAVKNNINR
ncbi:LOW QUALITY PROTEIN: uncharacterized protein LOC114530333 [Dendronephthya gigantea]|uniref:LOW QUALITY PROTEIN: uncharacterized protein LOC114530333 n=1 Tax=Dendronephthya gigantea TaxID=151771 RepID=UPI00106B8EBC|nr:LOW QUALITY PROTEIN: uncharacterized protein LOC114530333 [Dendronephthya gigantea]